jgi:hypothetical protein
MYGRFKRATCMADTAGRSVVGNAHSFLPTRALSFDNSVLTSTDVLRYSRPFSSYNRRGDPTESALLALPFVTWPVPGEFYRDYIAWWLCPILDFTFS